MPKIYIPTPVFDTLSETIELYKLIYDADNPRHQIKKYLEHCFSKSDMTLPSFSIKDFHKQCDHIPHTFTLIRTEFDKIIGGKVL